MRILAWGENYRLTEPQILGHEASGVVSEVGEGVTGLRVGDRVTIEPGGDMLALHTVQERPIIICAPTCIFYPHPLKKARLPNIW